MSSSLNSRIVDLVAPRARQSAVASERRRALLLALAGLPFAARASMECTHPSEGRVPVSDPMTSAHRSAGT